MFAPTNDVSRHIGSPQVRQTPKTPVRTRTRPPISRQCPSIEEREREKRRKKTPVISLKTNLEKCGDREKAASVPAVLPLLEQ